MPKTMLRITPEYYSSCHQWQDRLTCNPNHTSDNLPVLSKQPHTTLPKHNRITSTSPRKLSNNFHFAFSFSYSHKPHNLIKNPTLHRPPFPSLPSPTNPNPNLKTACRNSTNIKKNASIYTYTSQRAPNQPTALYAATSS